ncbi:MAG TPA: thioredoxin family protein [Balneolaceae bacterium]
MNTEEKVITPEVINEAYNYEEYRRMIDDLLEEGKTTGTNYSDEMIEYTRMNVHRMNRLDKQVKLSDSLKEKLQGIQEQWIWLVLTEAWCGDAAQNIPVIAKMAEESENIEIRLILRDENLEVMDEYLTNGGRSIPKLVCLNAEFLEEKGSWGPRPDSAQRKAMEWKNDPDITMEEWAEKLHGWYARNKTQEIQSEFEKLVEEWT